MPPRVVAACVQEREIGPDRIEALGRQVRQRGKGLLFSGDARMARGHGGRVGRRHVGAPVRPVELLHDLSPELAPNIFGANLKLL